MSEQIGQLLMVAISSGGLSASHARTLADAHAGSVILLGNSTAGAPAIRRLVRRLRSAADVPDGTGLLLAVDQEGGQVQRLRGAGFDSMPSARRQAQLSTTRLRRDAAHWGRQLRRAGVDANLAPVADVVPASLVNLNRPIGVLHRGYGSDPTVVAAKTSAFVEGMQSAHIATAVKHFPGLGRVRGNTDFQAHVVDNVTTRGDATLKGFRASVRAGVDMVMVSSAYYPKIDGANRAAFSRTVIDQLLREDLHFTGVVISDDLAARAMRDLSPGRRMVTFLRAGGDLAIIGQPRLVPAMVRAVKAEARSNATFAASLTDKTARVLQLKARRGRAHCG